MTGLPAQADPAVKDYPQFPSSRTVAQGYLVGPSVSRVARCGEGPRGHVNDPRRGLQLLEVV